MPEYYVLSTLNIFDAFCGNIKFATQKESFSNVPFLDTNVICTVGNKVILDWCRKESRSDNFRPSK